MNVAIYAIAKNEEHHVERWLRALLAEFQDGDSITVLDTGSTDGTVKALRNEAAMSGLPDFVRETVIKPWRFDVARNAALALADPSADIAWALDLDEVPQPGWRSAIEAGWREGATRLRYRYVWSWMPDGSPGVTYYADKLHARHGFRWRHACHEVLAHDGEEKHVWTDDLQLHHHPDTSKSRGSYIDLMALALREDPTDDRMQHYYARELMYQGRNDEAEEWFRKHLDNPRSVWRHERSQSMLYLSGLRGDGAWRSMWLYRALAECPERAEVWLAAAKFEAESGSLSVAAGFAQRALACQKDLFYLSDPGVRERAAKLLLSIAGAGKGIETVLSSEQEAR